MAFFYKLKLLKPQFNTLKKYEGNQLVSQFFYPITPKEGSPKLYAYSMLPAHQSDEDPPEILDYDSPSDEPLAGRDQVLGDLQIKVGKIKKLIDRASSGSGNYDHLLFTPKYNEGSKHIYFQISVVPSVALTDETEDANPSPPASAIFF
jgi:hypothetical protein